MRCASAGDRNACVPIGRRFDDPLIKRESGSGILGWKEPLTQQDERIEASRKLWTLEVRRVFSNAMPPGEEALDLSRQAALWLRQITYPVVMVAGVSLRVPEKSVELAWLQVMEWECGRIKRNLLRYLTGYRSEMPDLTLLTQDAAGMGNTNLEGEIEGVQVDRVSRSLLAEIGGGAKCNPVGSFRVVLPREAILCAYGVRCLRIWIDPPGAMWTAFEREDQIGLSVRWSAAPPHLNRWILTSWSLPMVHVTLAALWRDLCLRADALQGGSMKSHKMGEVHGLPRVRFGACITWEPPAFLTFHHPVESQVSGHLRRLPYGKRASRVARLRARRNGIVRLPPGMTFVRPHRRSL